MLDEREESVKRGGRYRTGAENCIAIVTPCTCSFFYLHMWQSHIQVYYSVTYFNCVTIQNTVILLRADLIHVHMPRQFLYFTQHI